MRRSVLLDRFTLPCGKTQENTFKTCIKNRDIFFTEVRFGTQKYLHKRKTDFQTRKRVGKSVMKLYFIFSQAFTPFASVGHKFRFQYAADLSLVSKELQHIGVPAHTNGVFSFKSLVLCLGQKREIDTARLHLNTEKTCRSTFSDVGGELCRHDDIALRRSWLTKGDIRAESVSCGSVAVTSCQYGLTGSHMTALLRNPHIVKNEEVVVTPPYREAFIRRRYLSHLRGVVMVEPWSLIAERLGGADYDGDMVKVIREPVICESIASHYKETANPFEDRFASRNNLPLLSIPTADPQLRNANDLHARFEAVKSTFSSRVGQISNAALDRSILAYDENADADIKEKCRQETETLAILTGLEIDSAKSGIKPDLSAYLHTDDKPRSRYLKYKRLLEDVEDRPAWYEDTFAEQMKDYIDGTDWESVTANVEKLPYYAYMLKKHTPRKVIKPAPASELFTFARHENWKENLDPSLFPPIRTLIDTYDSCLRRIRSHKHPTPGNSKRRDIDRILTMRDQENAYDTDSLYAPFTGMDATHIKAVRDALRAEQWHFMKPEERLSFLHEYLPEEAFRAYDGLFSDFRMGGYRVFGDIICDIDDANRQADKAKLHYKHDTPEMTAMIDAYNNRIPGTDYREAVAETCRVCIAKITPPFQAIRYAEAMDRRDFIFDVLLEEAEFYLIGGGNG